MRASHAGGRLKVTISGRLTTADVGRLEHVCSTALTSQNPNLDIYLDKVTEVDALAAMFLRRLAARGARIVAPQLS
jgi:hypothetical protein